MKTDLETLIPLLVGLYRKLSKEKGPLDKLQTREFRKIIVDLKKLHSGDYNLNDFETLSAYLLYDFTLHYQQGLSLIGEIPTPIHRVLDVAAGALPFSLAAAKWGASEIIALDKSTHALDAGAEILGRMGYPSSARKWTFPSEIPVEGSFDLIILGHALFELTTETDRLIDKLLTKLTREGFLLIVDSSQEDVNRKILQLRDRLVQKGVPVQAPCVWKGECPALKSKAPCYAQRIFEKPHIIKEIQRASHINLSSLKMSYLLLKSPLSPWPETEVKPVWRVISPPIETYQSKLFYLCGTDGKRTLSSHLLEHPKESRAFEYLKRGELISLHDTLETGQAFEIVQGTKIIVEAPLGKPSKIC